MKKLLASFICLSFISMPAYSAITDEFAYKTLDKNLKIQQPIKAAIVDSFVEQSLDKNLKFKPVSYKPIKDNFAEQNKNKGIYSAKTVNYQESIPKAANKTFSKKIVIIDQNSMTAIPIKIKAPFTTKAKAQEGDFLDFETTKDTTLNKKHYPAGTTVKARVENISLNKSMGVPADLIIGNFTLNGVPLGGEINKTGANRSLWVYPCMYGTLWFFGIGVLFIPIRGGHAKIKTTETYTLYAK